MKSRDTKVIPLSQSFAYVYTAFLRLHGHHRRWEASRYWLGVPLTRRQRKARMKANQGNWGEAQVLAFRHMYVLEEEIR